MKKSLLSIATASVLLASVGLASAQTGTTTTTESSWTADQGRSFSEYSTIKKYSSFSDPAFKAAPGSEVPSGVTLYPIPDTVKIQSADRYRYGMINDHPVVVESTTRKVVHSWE